MKTLKIIPVIFLFVAGGLTNAKAQMHQKEMQHGMMPDVQKAICVLHPTIGNEVH